MSRRKKMKIKNIIRWFLIIGIIIIPIILWSINQPLNQRFVNLSATTTSFGQILGLLGMTLLSLTVILGARLKFLENYFLGLNRIYVNHHKFGSVALIFLLFHPLLLSYKYLVISSRSAALFFLPNFDDLAKDMGIIALLLMIFLLILTLYFSLKYHIWKFSHKFLCLVLLLAGLHLIFISSDVSQNQILRIYMIGLFCLAMLAALYRVIFRKVAVRYYNYFVEDIKILNGNIFEITMKPVGEKINFNPGQFGFFSFIQGGFSREFHPFSFTSAPQEEKLKISVKNLGDYTSKLGELKPGAKVKIEGPFGRFNFTQSANPKQIWIAGGIGITPFLSMVKNLTATSYVVDFYWCLHDPQEAVFLEQLKGLEDLNQNLKIKLFYSINEGHINSEIINKRSGGTAGKDIFLCGPVSMMKSLKKQLKLLDRNIKIYSEEFSL